MPAVGAKTQRGYGAGLPHLEDALPGCHVPNADESIRTTRGHALPVQADRDLLNQVRMHQRRRNRHALADVPHPRGLVAVAGSDILAVAAKRETTQRSRGLERWGAVLAAEVG